MDVHVPRSDDEREVDLTGDDDAPILVEQTRDDTDYGWGDRPSSSNDERLLEDRPPHWG